MNEDFGLDVMMEDVINGGYGYILDQENDFENDDYYYRGDEIEWDDDEAGYDW